MSGEKLTGKQKLFADYYIGEARLNGTEAMRLTGHEGNSNVLAASASRMLRNVKVRAYIEAQLKPLIISPNETLTILSAHAKGRITDVMNDTNELDLNLAKQRGTDSLIKKLKIKRTKKVVERVDDTKPADFNEDEEKEILETSVIFEQVEFEIHDPQAALEKVGKYHKLFTEKVEHSGEVATYQMSKEEWEKRAANRLKDANKTADKFNE